MRTSLKYVVNKKEKFDIRTEKMVSVINGRGFEFSVSGAKTQEEHLRVLNDFYNFLMENNYSSDFFGSGTWEENVKMRTTKEFEFLYIPIENIEEKEQVELLYKEWKVRR